MATRYWAAGVNGNWNSTSSWSASATGTPAGASVPVSGDTAIFNASSGTVTATLDIGPTVAVLTCTGFTGTLAFGANIISLDGIGTVFTGSTVMTVTGTPQIILTNSSASNRTLLPAAVTESNSISFRITAGTGQLFIPTGAVRNLDFTDGVNDTGYGGQAQNMSVTIYGNFKASTNMTKAGGSASYTFTGATTGTRTIITNNVVFDNPFLFNSTAATPTDVIFQLQDNLTAGVAGGTSRTTTLIAGKLDLNGKTLTASVFSSSNTNTRILAFGTGKIVVNGNSGFIFNINVNTGLTVSGTGRLVEANTGGSGTRTLGGGSGLSEGNAVNILVSSGSDIVIFSGSAPSFGNVSFAGFTGTISNNTSTIIYGDWTFGSGMATLAVTGAGSITFAATSAKTITFNGKSFNTNSINFNGVNGTWAMQDALTIGTLSLTNGTLKLRSGTTSTVGSFVTPGANQVYLQATTPGVQATISAASGINTATNISIQDSNATGGAYWRASNALGTVNVSNNSGWLFTGWYAIANNQTPSWTNINQS